MSKQHQVTFTFRHRAPEPLLQYIRGWVDGHYELVGEHWLHDPMSEWLDNLAADGLIPEEDLNNNLLNFAYELALGGTTLACSKKWLTKSLLPNASELDQALAEGIKFAKDTFQSMYLLTATTTNS